METWAGPGSRTSQYGELLGQTLPPTLSMVIGSLILARLSSERYRSHCRLAARRLDRGLQVVSTLVQAVPGFLVALVLALVFAVQLRMFPATGFTAFNDSPVRWLASITLPVIALALGSLASIALQVRGSMIDVIQQDFVRTLRSRGLPERSVVVKHALRSAAGPTPHHGIPDVHRGHLQFGDH